MGNVKEIKWATSGCTVIRHNLYDKKGNSDSKIHGANMGPNWVLSAPDGSRVGPKNLAIWEGTDDSADS